MVAASCGSGFGPLGEGRSYVEWSGRDGSLDGGPTVWMDSLVVVVVCGLVVVVVCMGDLVVVGV